MKIEDLTIERLLEVANLMEQLHIPRSIIELAKELEVKRTDLMRYINEHPKNINWKVALFRKYGKNGRISSEKQVAIITGIYLDPHENPLTEEYADDRRKEHWIRLDRIWYEGWVFGFEIASEKDADGKKRCYIWENQPEDIEKYKGLPGVEEHQFALGYAQGSYMSKCHPDSVKSHDFNKMIEEGHKLGLRFTVAGFFDKEINSLDDLPDDHFC